MKLIILKRICFILMVFLKLPVTSLCNCFVVSLHLLHYFEKVRLLIENFFLLIVFRNIMKITESLHSTQTKNRQYNYNVQLKLSIQLTVIFNQAIRRTFSTNQEENCYLNPGEISVPNYLLVQYQNHLSSNYFLQIILTL